MRDRTVRTFILIISILSLVTAAGAVFAESTTATWPTYHYDQVRSGQNSYSTHITTPSTIDLVWAFPRGVGSAVEEGLSIVDDLNDPKYVDHTPLGWMQHNALGEAWDTRFLWASAVTTGSDNKLTGNKLSFTWRPKLDNADMPKGLYKIYIWIPEDHGLSKTLSTQAQYTVYDDKGATTIEFNQQDGGAWQPLSARSFSFTGKAGVDYKVVLTNYTEDSESDISNKDIAVIADAVKFVPSTGMEIYASPASAIYPDWSYTSPNGYGSWTGDIPVVYAATVEEPLAQGDDAPDTGAVYCINSVTPINVAATASSNKDLYNDIATQLGVPLWRYPQSGTNVDNRNEIEGPIEGGIYASPTYAYASDPNTTGGQIPVVYVAGMDRQVYCLNAYTGALLWKGPGLTVSEKPKGTSVPSGWTEITGREDAFGGQFLTATCAKNGGTTVNWDFSSNLNLIAEPVGDGYPYSVYAWIPAQAGGSPDATYTITYVTQSAGSVSSGTATVHVDQSSIDNQGRWVKLGSSYFNVSKVTLSNSSAQDSPTSYSVFADAVMIVPDSIESFGYCTPVVQSSSSDITVQDVYAVTSNGRMIDMAAIGSKTGLGRLNWVYPKLRTKLTISGTSDQEQDALGEVGASLAYGSKTTSSGDALYVATNTGEIHCTDINGNELWSFTGADGFTSSPAISDGRLYIGSTGGIFYCLNAANGNVIWKSPDDTGYSAGTTPVPFGAFRFSTPAIGEEPTGIKRAWIAGSDGKIRSFDIRSGISQRRLWVDFDDNGTEVKDYGAVRYVEPSLRAAVQGSIALDARSTTKTSTTMYVGDMTGILHWYDAKDGTYSNWDYDAYQTDGELFSSPNLTTVKAKDSGTDVDWIYIGGSDGRIYAFSNDSGAWGGTWHGGDWPFEGNPGDRKISSRAAIDTDIQFDILTNDFYKASLSGDPEPMSGSNYKVTDQTIPINGASNPGVEWIVSQDMKAPTISGTADAATVKTALTTAAKERRKQDSNIEHVFGRTARLPGSTDSLYFEWGESLNIAVWNLPGLDDLYGTGASKRTSIRFRMTNSSAGNSAGSQIPSKIADVLKEYTVLDKNKAATDSDGNTVTSAYQPLTYSDDGKSVTVKRSYALAKINLTTSSSNPPSPGPGWVLTAEIKRKKPGTTGTYELVNIPLARLKNGTPPEPVTIDTNKDGTPDDYKEQLLGVNNPLAIRDDGDPATASTLDYIGISWPYTNPYVPDRQNDEAHYNGNAYTSTASSGETVYNTGKMPVIDLESVQHGTRSREASLGVMDRSATGCNVTGAGTPPKTQTLDKFRINAGDLRWMGGDTSIVGMRFPWEQGPGSADYPNIYQRREDYRKLSDDADPSRAATSLPAVQLTQIGSGNWDTQYPMSKTLATTTSPKLRPETVFVTVDVPKYQPANVEDSSASANKYKSKGYGRQMEAYVDSDNDKKWDSGTSITGRPSTYQEAYRRFRVGLSVPADPRIEVEEQTVDVGKAPHGLGENVDAFNAYNPDPSVQQWFKKLTIKNNGNVNLFNLRIANDNMYTDLTNKSYPLPGIGITSSLDRGENGGFGSWPFRSRDDNGNDIGFTLTKPRVGDPDPSVMSIPDRRRWDTNFDNTAVQAKDILSNFVTSSGASWPSTSPLPVEVSVRIPLGQSIGTYVAPFLPVYCDLNNDSILEAGGSSSNYNEPFSDPSFHLKVTVRENQLTGGVSPITLPEIDDASGLPRVGDATPAAFRDAKTGDIHLFWSSNRMFDSSLYPDFTNPQDPAQQAFASAPWFIDRATLVWDPSVANGWTPVSEGGSGSGTPTAIRWWKTPDSSPFLPEFEWPSTLLSTSTKLAIMNWNMNGKSAMKSVRHTSPTLAVNENSKSSDQTWLAWVGTADLVDSVTQKTTQEHRIFYTNATNGDVTNSSSSVLSIEHDPTMLKRSPSMAVYDENMWMFWQGGDGGKWSIYYSVNPSGPEHPSSAWTADTQLRTPDCLSSVASPNAIHRPFSTDKATFDIVYSGISKLTQNSDIMLSRYLPGYQDRTWAPSRIAAPMPRVYGETLERDPQFGFFTSQHLAWKRPGTGANASIDHWGECDPAQPWADFPYIHVIFPAGYPLSDGSTLSANTIISATDGSIEGGATQAPAPISPDVDAETGVYIYKYTNALANELLGDMLVDYSSGIVRFTKQLKEVKTDNGIKSPDVVADYTPQTWRLTTGLLADSSPMAFIERQGPLTSGTSVSNYVRPGLDSSSRGDNPDVDRLWTFWKKSDRNGEGTNIYYATYRIGVDLAKIGLPAVPMVTSATSSGALLGSVASSANFQVSGNVGAWEVDRTGTKVFFTLRDERYQSLMNTPLGYAGPITIKYKDADGKGVTWPRTGDDPDISWIPELSEQSFATEGNVNEGSIYAFADFDPTAGTKSPLPSSKIWVFWTSTRGGTSDLFWQTISPGF